MAIIIQWHNSQIFHLKQGLLDYNTTFLHVKCKLLSQCAPASMEFHLSLHIFEISTHIANSCCLVICPKMCPHRYIYCLHGSFLFQSICNGYCPFVSGDPSIPPTPFVDELLHLETYHILPVLIVSCSNESGNVGRCQALANHADDKPH